MKNTKKCPKCEANTIICIEGSSGFNGAGNNIPLNIGTVLVTRYVCAKCGYSEEWIDKQRDIDRLYKKFGKERR